MPGAGGHLLSSPDISIVGTDGDDVIVTKGSRVIFALDGNDRVCVTGKSGQVYAGFGDDVVDTTGRRRPAVPSSALGLTPISAALGRTS